jgi:hypothetical protein
MVATGAVGSTEHSTAVSNNTLFDKFVASKVESVDTVSEPKAAKSVQTLPKKNGRKHAKQSVVAVLPMQSALATFQSGTGTLTAYLQSTPRK